MGNEKTSVLNNGLIWFGAAISIAEILTGTFLAPLGFAKGFAAIIIGHLIGCALLYFSGIIGGKTGKSSMETVKISFGDTGSGFFALLNVLQLIGWTAVMIISGARAAGVVADPMLGFGGEKLWSIVIALLIIVWILIGVKNLGKLNVIAMGGLFVLTVVLSFVVFKGGNAGEISDVMSFGAGIELSIAMPLSWLPLISDYTRFAKKPKEATLASSVVYFFASSWMFIIGLGAAIFTGESDIAKIMLTAGLGVFGILIIIFSTVTTTFMDAYSAGVSLNSMSGKLNEKWVAVIICIIGAVLAMFTPIEQYEDFLYLIGSVFAPMIAIQITDYFILKKDYSSQKVNVLNLLIWLAGFIVYRRFMSFDIVIGSTIPAMIVTFLLCIIVNGGKKLCLKK